MVQSVFRRSLADATCSKAGSRKSDVHPLKLWQTLFSHYRQEKPEPILRYIWLNDSLIYLTLHFGLDNMARLQAVAAVC